MNLKTFVKVGSITNLSDARFTAGFGVDLLGFDLNPQSPNYISIDEANEIMGWVAGPAFVAELGNMPIDEIIKLQKENNFPFIEVDNLSTLEQLQDHDYSLILRLSLSTNEDLHQLSTIMTSEAKPAHLIVDCLKPELVPEIENLLNDNNNMSLIKAYDVELSQLDHIIQVQPYHGIELKGSHEEKPGFKEYDDLADILEALEVED